MRVAPCKELAARTFLRVVKFYFLGRRTVREMASTCYIFYMSRSFICETCRVTFAVSRYIRPFATLRQTTHRNLENVSYLCCHVQQFIFLFSPVVQTLRTIGTTRAEGKSQSERFARARDLLFTSVDDCDESGRLGKISSRDLYSAVLLAAMNIELFSLPKTEAPPA